MKTGLMTIAIVFLFGTHVAQAEQLKVSWIEPEKYIDVKGAEESKKRFQKRVFKQLEKHLTKLSEKLPAGTHLELKVDNVNLAGDVRYNFSLQKEIRLVTHMYSPMLSFEYKVKKADRVLLTDKVKLTDMAFMDRSSRMRRDEFLSYEKQLLTRWFKKDLQPAIAQELKNDIAVM